MALAESGGKIAASNSNTNGTTDHGIFQINDVNLGTGGVASAYASNITNPLDNAKAAVAVYKSQGWGGWSTFNSGAYKTYSNQGINAAKVATSNTADQLAGALLPLLGIAGGLGLGADAAVGEAAGGGGVGSAISAAAKTAVKTGATIATGDELASIWKDIKGDWLYGVVTVAAILIGVLLIYRAFSGGGSNTKVVPVPV